MSQNKVRWGVLGVAKIATEKVIPAMQRGQFSEIVGIASRSLDKATAAAQRLGLPKAYGSYEALLADPDIDAIYNPLPNHLHVPLSIAALEAGKHVLCEKPIALTAQEGQLLVDAGRRFPQLKLMEAFMYRHHPQWVTAKKLVDAGQIGTLRTIQSFFSYFNNDGGNIRNMPELGGGSLMDIGCYPISLSRFIFGQEPARVIGHVEYDPQFQTDRIASAIMDFGTGTATFTCSTQSFPYQRVHIVGTDGRIEIEIPFNAPPDRPCKMWHATATSTSEIVLTTCDQYTIQGDLMSQAILHNTAVPTPIDDAVGNMHVIEAIVAAGKTGSWVRPAS
ncbi:MAG: Gfo/Idh/MocA family oxidoreductase [Planctomycetota bacterium]